MDLKEYEEIKNLDYFAYFDYLQQKYGKPSGSYMDENYFINGKIKRIKDGLCIHHKYEYIAPTLYYPTTAINRPLEWQSAENLTYVDLLEHVLLHILICELPITVAKFPAIVTLEGMTKKLLPNLNDSFSGCIIDYENYYKCFDRVKKEKDTYMVLLKRIKELFKRNPFFSIKQLQCTNPRLENWEREFDRELFDEIEKL